MSWIRLAEPCDEESSTQAGPDTPFHCISVRIIPQGPGGPSVGDGDVSGSIVANIPGDELAMSIGYREMATKTLDEQCMLPGNLLSELMMCGLDCPWLSPFLFVSLGGWVAASRGQLVIFDSHRDCWEPGENRVLTNFPHECVLVLCQDSTSRSDLNLIYHLSELVNHFEL